MGYHDLFISRRKAESIDIQQMKQQALEIKTRRQVRQKDCKIFICFSLFFSSKKKDGTSETIKRKRDED
jgi:hypothetical protein